MFKNNLQALLNKERMKVPEFSQIVNIKSGTIHSWLIEGKEPKYEKLVQIKAKYREAKGLNINIDYLISGEGSMFIIENVPSIEDAKIGYNELIARLSKVEKKVFQIGEDKQP